MDRPEHRSSISSTTVVGGLAPHAVHVGAHNDGTVGIHVTGRGVFVSLFGTLDDLVAVNTKLGVRLARIAAANTTDPTDRIGATP